MIEAVRISQRGKEQIAVLKRKTGIQTQNVICRWALCLSLADSQPIRAQGIPKDTALEIAWRTFAGSYADIYEKLLLRRCLEDGVNIAPDELASVLRQHVHRGLGILMGRTDLRGIEALTSIGVGK